MQRGTLWYDSRTTPNLKTTPSPRQKDSPKGRLRYLCSVRNRGYNVFLKGLNFVPARGTCRYLWHRGLLEVCQETTFLRFRNRCLRRGPAFFCTPCHDGSCLPLYPVRRRHVQPWYSGSGEIRRTESLSSCPPRKSDRTRRPLVHSPVHRAL